MRAGWVSGLANEGKRLIAGRKRLFFCPMPRVAPPATAHHQASSIKMRMDFRKIVSELRHRWKAGVSGLALLSANFFAAQALAAVDPPPPGPGWGLAVGLLGAGGLIAGGLLVSLLCLWQQRRQGGLGRALLAAVPNPRQAIDAKGQVLYANPAFRAAYGESDRPTPALLLEEIGDDEEARGLIQRLDSNARQGAPGQAEVRVLAPDGNGSEAFEWRLVTAYPVSSLPGAVYWGIDDITSRRQVEEVIHDEQERFVDLLEHAPIGFYSVDGDGTLSLRQPHFDGVAAPLPRGPGERPCPSSRRCR